LRIVDRAELSYGSCSMSRRTFKPTAEQRGWVEAMIGYGIPEAEIRLLIKHPQTGKPISLQTLRRHFAEEIATGAVKAKALIGDRIIAWILGRDGDLQDDRARVRLAILFARARMGWTAANCPSRSVIRAIRRMRGAASMLKSPGSRSLKAGETDGSFAG
jgi:hypothetical protein